MKYISLCSGIEAATIAWHPLGWEAIAFAEIEAFPSAVLAHHWPEIPNLGDITKHNEWKITTTPDVLIGGTPCQSYSIAGKREGLGSLNGKLMLTYVEITAKYRPRWLVWENVPGCLSSNEGQDFATLLASLTGRTISVPQEGWKNSGTIDGINTAYGIAWRVLDAQYFGVAQRRRRVFVVGYLGDWRRAAAVLFEQASLSGNPPPSRNKGKNPPPHAQNRPGISHWEGSETHPTLSQSSNHGGIGANNQELFSQNGAGLVPETLCISTTHAHTQGTNKGQENVIAIAFTQNQRDEVRQVEIPGALAAQPGMKQQTYIAFQDTAETQTARTLTTRNDGSPCHDRGPDIIGCSPVSPTVTSGAPFAKTGNSRVETEALAVTNCAVRRLTPIECERLQGFPDNHTLIPTNKGRTMNHWEFLETADYLLHHGFTLKEAIQLASHPDGPRYKACGNSMAVPVIKWIGERIEIIEGMICEQETI